MSAIAARVGGSKGTLYNYFTSKEDLFLACVSRVCEALREQMSSLAAEKGDVRETLTRLGRRYVEVVSSEEVVRRFRMIVAEAERAPELARAFYETGPAQGRALLAEYIERAMRQGDLVEADPLRAAGHFLSLCYNNLSKARLCGVEPAPDAATIEREVADGVRIFMAAYGPSAKA
ncbi:MAG: TetR/AcrR family transcriptional regulator [Pseudomonadota bacterium]